MDINTLHSQLRQNQVEHLYMFTGTEIEVQKIYYNQIAKIANLDIVRVDSIADIYGKLRNTSFIQLNHCYLIRDDKEIQTNEQLWVDINKLVGNNIIIFTFTNLDKRTKFYKRWSSSFCDFASLPHNTLVKYISKDIELSDNNMDKLIDICESDYSRILLEIDKIKAYSKALNINTDKSFIGLLHSGAIYQPPKDAIFDLVDAILKHKVNDCFNLLRQCYAVGEATMVMLSVLYNNTKQVLQVQSCKSKDISKVTGLTNWQIKCARDKVGVYSNGDLVYLMTLIQKLETGIKLGTMEDSIAMEYLLTNFL